MHFVHKRASAASLTFPLASFTLAFTGTISSLKRPAWIHSTMSSIQPGATGFIERGKQICWSSVAVVGTALNLDQPSALLLPSCGIKLPGRPFKRLIIYCPQ